MDKEMITLNTELKPSDIVKNRKGKIYRIETFHENKTTFKVSPWPVKAGEDNPSYIIIELKTMVAKEWEKLDKDNIDTSTPEVVLSNSSTEAEIDSLIIKEDRPSKEESVDF